MARDSQLDRNARGASTRPAAAELSRLAAAPASSTALFPANPLIALAQLLGRQAAREHLLAISECAPPASVGVSDDSGAIGPTNLRKKAPT